MDVNSRQQLNDAIVAVQRFANSRKLDAIHAARSGVSLSTVTVGVLRQVVRRGPVSASELSKAALIQPAALSRQLNTLKDVGHIEVARDEHDGRVSIVSATSKGREALQRFDEVNDDLLSAQLSQWSDEEVDDLAKRMHRLVADLRAQPGQ